MAETKKTIPIIMIYSQGQDVGSFSKYRYSMEVPSEFSRFGVSPH